jgi:formyl-CoA transferase
MKAVDFFQLFDHPSEGKIRVMGVPETWSESQPDIRRHAPRIGENTVELLSEYGFASPEIDALLAAGAAIDSSANTAA